MELTGQRVLRFEDVDSAQAAVAVVCADPLAEVAGEMVLSMASDGANGLRTEVDRAFLSVRPSQSGRELHIEGRVVLDADSETDVALGRQRMRDLIDGLGAVLADPERHALSSELGSQEDLSPGADDGRGGGPSSTPADARRDLELVLSCIDLTTLRVDDTPGRVRALCSVGVQPDPTDDSVGPVAAVCVYPSLAATARAALVGSAVKVASVAGSFPSALSPFSVRIADVDAAVAAGAHEVDVVFNLSGLLAGRTDEVASELVEYRERTQSCVLKVILETGLHPTPAVTRLAAELAISAGADFLKTSTGMSAVGATPESVRVLARAVADHHRDTGEKVGVKVSGGVGTAAEALEYVGIVREILGTEWLDPTGLRFGASRLLGDVVARLAASPRS